MWGEISFEEWFYAFIKKHWGKIIGVLLGLVFSLLIIFIGFWKTVFVMFCVLLGYFLGKRLDDEGEFYNWWERFFRKR